MYHRNALLLPSSTKSSATQRIANVPLKTGGFQAALPDLQAQVVTVRASTGTGSGFQIGDGLWLTNHHVAGGMREVRLRFPGGREIKADVVTSNAQRDVALLRSESIGLPGLPLRTERPAVADKVYVIGSPLGEKHEGSVSSGVISAFRMEKGLSLIQSDAGITHGNSGGPMFDEHGNVVGISVSKYETTSLNFFIPIDDALQKLGLEIEPSSIATAAPKKASR